MPRFWKRYLVFGVLAILLAVALLPVWGVFFEPQPVQWTNVPFPIGGCPEEGQSQVRIDTHPANRSLGTCVERENITDRAIVTNVARRLVNEDTGKVLTLAPGNGIVDPGKSSQEGGLGLPAPCHTETERGCVTVGHHYHIEQYAQFPGRWRTFTVPLRTQSFLVVSDAP